MTTLIHERVAMARAGTNPTVIGRMPSGWAVLGDVQFLRGYSLLLADPVVVGLNELAEAQRSRFLLDMAILGDALFEVVGPYRVNYEILGNTDAALHAHVFPRYLSEPDELRAGPVWLYDRAEVEAVPFDAARDAELLRQLAEAIGRRISSD